MLYVLIDALHKFVSTLEQEFISHGCGNATYVPLLRAGFDYLRILTAALDEYFVTYNADRLHRDIIGASLEFAQVYEIWIDSLKSPDLQHAASKVFHSFILRHGKGMIKAYRIWQIDIKK